MTTTEPRAFPCPVTDEELPQFITKEATGWYRDDDPLHTRFTTDDRHNVECFLVNKDRLLHNLGLILDRELSCVREFHLVRLSVEIELCH
jgi:hypothetical protein